MAKPKRQRINKSIPTAAERLGTVLIIEDETRDQALLKQIIAPYCEITIVPNGERGLAIAKQREIDVILLEMDGFNALQAIKQYDPTIEVIMVSKDFSSQAGFRSAQLGAVCYVTKQSVAEDPSSLLTPLRQALDRRQLLRKNEALRLQHPTGVLLGKSDAMQQVKDFIHLAATATDSDILILGETGVGKSMIARIIHEQSSRGKNPLMTIDCNGMTRDLIQNELFGHEKGSFTGATETKLGKFEYANGGTVFLDEIGDVPLEIQVKLLRVLQDRVVERMGGLKQIPIDVRVISATNQNLIEAVAHHTFRRDLYYRLNKLTLRIPPLRERGEDIPLLLNHFLRQLNQQYHKQKEMAPAFITACCQYAWPGNVREMMNLLDRIVSIHPGHHITPEDLPPEFFQPQTPFSSASDIFLVEQEGYKGWLKQQERLMISAILKKTYGNQSEAAKIMGIDRSTLHERVKMLGIRIEKRGHPYY